MAAAQAVNVSENRSFTSQVSANLQISLDLNSLYKLTNCHFFSLKQAVKSTTSWPIGCLCFTPAPRRC